MDWGFLFVTRPESQMTLIQQTLTIAGCHMSHSHNQTNDADDGGKPSQCLLLDQNLKHILQS